MTYFLLLVIVFLFCLVVYANNKLNKALSLEEKATELATEYQDRCCVYCANYHYLCLYIKSAQVDNEYWRNQLDKAVLRCQDDIKKFEDFHKEN